MRIGLARRGFSRTGGAERYLRRFAAALTEAGHDTALFGTEEWPQAEWNFGPRHVLDGTSPRTFADALRAMKPRDHCDFLFSFERVWECDCYRAGDGIHQAWMERRAAFEPWWRVRFRNLNPKHRELLELERSMFEQRGARTTICNSQLVRHELVTAYGYPTKDIEVIYNGIPPLSFRKPPLARDDTRRQLGVREKDLMILFLGSGWERKGLRFAVAAMAELGDLPQAKLVVAGRGREAAHRGRGVQFAGPVADPWPLLEAADLFLLPTLYDPFSNASLEAAAAGLPVITTRTNGFSELLQPGIEGEVLEDAADVGGIARAIRAWADPVRRADAKPAVQAIAARQTMDAAVVQTLAVLERLRAKPRITPDPLQS